MPVSIACPKCKTKYRLPDSALGKPLKCQKCGAGFRAPAPQQITEKPGQAQQLSTKASQPQQAVSKVLQPSQQDISKMGIEGAIKRQADIFSAPPPPTRSNPLGNFSIEDPGFADLEVVKQEVEEEVRSDGMESILGNPYASGPAKKSKGGFKRKSQAPAVDVRPYSVARIGIWMQLIAWWLLLAVAVSLLLITIIVAVIPQAEPDGIMAMIVGGIFIMTAVATPFVGLAAFVGQFLCLFAPNKDEKLFAGLAIGSLLGLIVLPIVILLVGLVGAAGLGIVSGSDAGEAGEAVGSLLGVAIILSPVALLLANVLFMFLFFQRLGRNIKAKAVEQAAKIAMGSWITSVANVVIFFIFLMVVGFLYRGDPSQAPSFLGRLLQIWFVLTLVLNLVVIVAMVAMGNAAVKHTKVV
jgi:hypothetical protein